MMNVMHLSFSHILRIQGSLLSLKVFYYYKLITMRLETQQKITKDHPMQHQRMQRKHIGQYINLANIVAISRCHNQAFLRHFAYTTYMNRKYVSSLFTQLQQIIKHLTRKMLARSQKKIEINRNVTQF